MKKGMIPPKIVSGITGFFEKANQSGKSLISGVKNDLTRSPKAGDELSLHTVPKELRARYKRQSSIEADILLLHHDVNEIEKNLPKEAKNAARREFLRILAQRDEMKLDEKREAELCQKIYEVSDAIGDDKYLEDFLSYKMKSSKKKSRAEKLNSSQEKNATTPKVFDMQKVKKSIQRMRLLMKEKSKLQFEVDDIQNRRAAVNQDIDTFKNYFAGKYGAQMYEWFDKKEKIAALESELLQIMGL